MANPASVFDRLNQWIRNSVTLKLVAVGVLILILMIPSAWISSLVTEREDLRDDATREVSSKWGGSQVIGGPVISIPYYVTTKNDNGETVNELQYVHFLPDSLDITGELKPEKRNRGIYTIILYNARLTVKGCFSKLNYNALQVPVQQLLPAQAIISFGITDMTGIKDNIRINMCDTVFDFNPGIATSDIFSSGISFPVNLNSNQPGNFAFNINLNGSSSINFLPFGKETKVCLQSNWGDPSFEGSFLPETRNISATGFTANWRVLQLNRNYPQQGAGKFIGDQFSNFGVKLLLPVDEYQKTMRSTKYCAMFIFLTFLTFFFVEVLNRTRIHPVQYLLVGSAIVLFYVLLLSLSEHLGFNFSYLMASVVILVLVTLYAVSVFKSKTLAGMLAVMLAILYFFFYSLLQLQDYSLLLGSFGLLVILATIMFLTRKVDWYSPAAKD